MNTVREVSQLGAAIERRESARAGIVFDPLLLPQALVVAGPFTPGAWPESSPVLGSGRGAAWFVRAPGVDAVLRHYRRGGLVRFLMADCYRWRGGEATRSVAEFRLLNELHAHGLPVPRPLAAGWQREGVFYRADILIERIEAARPWAILLAADLGSAAWEDVGVAIAGMHRAGIEHADLNVHNILVDALGKVWLIDFDRARRRAPGMRWRQRNLKRLRRSILKLVGGYKYQDALVDGWSRLCESYAMAMMGDAR